MILVGYHRYSIELFLKKHRNIVSRVVYIKYCWPNNRQECLIAKWKKCKRNRCFEQFAPMIGWRSSPRCWSTLSPMINGLADNQRLSLVRFLVWKFSRYRTENLLKSSLQRTAVIFFWKSFILVSRKIGQAKGLELAYELKFQRNDQICAMSESK